MYVSPLFFLSSSPAFVRLHTHANTPRLIGSSTLPYSSVQRLLRSHRTRKPSHSLSKKTTFLSLHPMA